MQITLLVAELRASPLHPRRSQIVFRRSALRFSRPRGLTVFRQEWTSSLQPIAADSSGGHGAEVIDGMSDVFRTFSLVVLYPRLVGVPLPTDEADLTHPVPRSGRLLRCWHCSCNILQLKFV